MADDDITLGVEADIDESAATRQANRLAATFADAFGAVAPKIARDLSRSINREFQRANVGGNTFDPFVRGAEEAFRSARFVADGAGRIADSFDQMGESGRRATRQINTEELAQDLDALRRRVDATRSTLQDLGAQPNLFAVIDRELENVLQRQRAFNDNLEQISRDPTLLAGYEESFRQARRVISGELDANLRLLINFKEDQRQVAAQLQRQEDNSTRLRVANIKQASSAFVVAEQGANAQRLAETRIAGQRQVQQERIAARTRIEIVRFTFRQIQILERGIAGVFRATGTIAQSAARTTASAVARIGNLFRRSNRDLNDGLNSALIARERSIDRSFARQTAEISSSVRQQSVILDRFERQASTGLVGAATGRSRLGGLFGAGIGVGGGFLLARQLREGFQETVNLNEALNKTREVFGDASDAIVSFSEESIEALFLTRSEALAAAADFGIFGKQAGLEGDDLAQFSEVLTRLATDLASFNNTPVDDAVRALGSALRGESEPISRFGVDTRQAALQTKALEIGLISSARTLTGSERTLAAYAQILDKTTTQQGDAARTADDFANSSKRAGAALTTAFAAATSALVPVAELVTNAALPALTALTNFIEGDLSPAMLIFRDALIGASIALAGLLVARVAAEAIQFLGLALRGAITPLGLLIVGVAAAGAALRIFSQRNERFAEAVRSVTAGLSELVGRGLDLAGRGLSLLVSLVRSQVIPALVAFGQIIDGPVIRGLEIAIGFIVTVAIPAFTRLAELLVVNIVPALQLVGRFLTGSVVPALRDFGATAIGVLAAVARFIGPAIDGFIELGDAIVRAFRTGDLTGLLGGLQAVAVGIGTVFANLGVLIFEALRPQVERAVGFISSAFDRIDFAAIGLRILEVVRLVGFVLGSIVSDPRFIQAIEAIAVAAIAVGAKFVQGFAQGVASNLPGLLRLLGGQLRFLVEEAVKFAFNNPATIGAIILAAFAARSLLNAFQRAGEAGGGSLARGVARGIARSPGQIAQAFSGLFGGTGAIQRAIERDAIRTAENFQRQFSRRLRDFQRLGFDTSGLLNTEVDERALRNLNASFDETVGKIGETRAAARLFGQRATEAVQGVSTGVSQLARVAIPGMTGSLVRARAGFSEAFTAISDGFARLREQGKLTGQALGTAVLGGFAAVVSGQQAGQGNTLLGLGGILSAAITTGLATGLPVIGLAVGAVGLLTAAFSANRASAAEAAREIAEYTSALEDARNFSEQVAGAASTVFENIRQENAGTQDLLLGLGFNYRQFADEVVRGTFDTTDALNTLAPAFGDASSEFIERVAVLSSLLGGLPQGVEEASREFEKFLPAGQTARDVAEAFDALTDESSELRAGLEEAARAQGFRELAGDSEAARQGAERFSEQIAESNDGLRRLGDSHPFVTVAREATESGASVAATLGATLESLFGQITDIDGYALDIDAGAAVDALLEVLGIGDQIEAQLKGLSVDAFADEYEGFGLSVADINRDIIQSTDETADAYADALGFLEDLFEGQTALSEEAAESVDLVKAAVQELNEQRTSGIRTQIERVRSQLDDAREAADRAREALTAFITGRYADTAQSAVDALIGNVGSIGSEIEDALLQGGVRGEAALRSAVGGFENQLAGIIQAGFDQGLRTQDEFANLLAPLFAALDEEVGDSASRILSTTDFEFGITDRAGASLRDSLQRALAGRQIEAGVSTIINAETEVRRLEDLLNAQQAQLEVEVMFDPEQIRAALAAAGATAAQLSGVDPNSVTAAQRSGLVAAVANANSVSAQQPVNITITESPDVRVEVSGTKDPVATAAEVVREQRAATSGRRSISVGGVRAV